MRITNKMLGFMRIEILKLDAAIAFIRWMDETGPIPANVWPQWFKAVLNENGISIHPYTLDPIIEQVSKEMDKWVKN